jgi:hypothetical protein
MSERPSCSEDGAVAYRRVVYEYGQGFRIRP